MPEVVAAVHGGGREGSTRSRCSGLTSYAGSTEWQGADCHFEEWEGHLPRVQSFRQESVRIRLMSALSASIFAPGRACGGKHGAGVCTIKRTVPAASAVPAAPKPSATLVPAALGDKAQFTRKRAAAEPSGETTDDDVATVMRAAVKKARGVAAPKTPPKAKPVAAPKTPPKAMPKIPPKAVMLAAYYPPLFFFKGGSTFL